MSDWIQLSPSVFLTILNGTQQETLQARPHQGTTLDPLANALEAATSEVRSAIRANGLNRLSADKAQIPSALLQCACSIVLLRLSQNWPLFRIAVEQETRIEAIEPELLAVRNGTTPITLPSSPEPDDTVRRSAGVSTLRQRTQPIDSTRLRGL